MKSQEQTVVNYLKENKQVSRNWALGQRITRLSAIILNLKKAGWDIQGKNERTHGGYGRGLDYVYRLNDILQ